MAQMVKNQPAIRETLSLIPGSGRCLGKWHGNPLQSFYLENPMDRGAWRVAVRGVAVRTEVTNTLTKDAS